MAGLGAVRTFMIVSPALADCLTPVASPARNMPTLSLRGLGTPELCQRRSDRLAPPVAMTASQQPVVDNLTRRPTSRAVVSADVVAEQVVSEQHAARRPG